jgi:hypothetical protein
MIVTELPADVDEFVCLLLSKEPTRRPATAQALLDELERLRGKLERKGEKLEWPAKLKPDTAEMAALPASLGGFGPEPDQPEPPRPWLKRPWVVVSLLALVVLTLVVSFSWEGTSASEMWLAAVPLVNSEDPADWDRAWDDYLDPLSRKYPDQYVDEVAAAKNRIRDRKELQRALAEGAKPEPRSEAERGYQRGLRLAQAGDAVAARRSWQAVVIVFGSLHAEARWVELSRAGIKALDRSPRPVQHDRASFDAAIDDVKHLPLWAREPQIQALEELAHDDPALLEAIRNVRKSK